MIDGDRSQAVAFSWGKLSLALACALLVGVNLHAGLLALSALAVVAPPAVRWRPMASLPTLRVYLPFAVAWLVFVAGYLRALHLFGHTVAPQPMLQALAESGTGLTDWWLLVLGIVVVAPFFEELLFRGYLFTALATVLPMWATQLITAVLFGLVHGFDYALPIAVLSLLFGYLRQRHRSLLPSMLAHAIHNGITVMVTLLWPAHLELLYPR